MALFLRGAAPTNIQEAVSFQHSAIGIQLVA
jgi:hypothetical protein